MKPNSIFRYCFASAFIFYTSIALAEYQYPIRGPEDKAENVEFGGGPHSLFMYHEPNSGVAWLNGAVSKGKLVSCQMFAEIPLARVETIFGGNCILEDQGQRSTVQVCRDTGVGEWEVGAIQPDSATKESLLDFMERNCPGG